MGSYSVAATDSSSSFSPAQAHQIAAATAEAIAAASARAQLAMFGVAPLGLLAPSRDIAGAWEGFGAPPEMGGAAAEAATAATTTTSRASRMLQLEAEVSSLKWQLAEATTDAKDARREPESPAAAAAAAAAAGGGDGESPARTAAIRARMVMLEAQVTMLQWQLAEATTEARREPESPAAADDVGGNAAAKREEKKEKGKAPESAEGDADEATRKRRVETFEESSR